jgi:tetratricopeptide (TPR) repeat protein
MKHLINPLLCLALLLSACQGGSHEASRKAKSGTDTIPARISELTEAIEDDASNADLYNQRAKCYLLDHRFDPALKDINKAITLRGNKTAYYVTLSDIQLLAGKPDLSLDALKKAVGLDPKDTEALLKLSKLYLIIKDYKNCYITVKQLLAIDNGIAAAYFTRAIALLEQGDTIRAADDLRQAVDRNQQYYEAYVQLGELYSIKKDPLAILYLQNALNIRPQSREALYMLGLFYQNNGQYEKAIATYLSLAKADTTFREATYNIGYIYLVYLKDFRKAATYFTESLKKDPAYVQAVFNRGYAYELAGDYKKAYEDYERALKIEVNYEKAIEGLNRLDKKSVRK